MSATATSPQINMGRLVAVAAAAGIALAEVRGDDWATYETVPTLTAAQRQAIRVAYDQATAKEGPPVPLLYTADGSEPPASSALAQYLVDRSPGAQGRGKFSPEGSTAWLSHFDASAISASAAAANTTAGDAATMAGAAQTSANNATSGLATVQNRISRVVEVELNYTSLLSLLAVRTITIELNPAMPDATYVPIVTRTGGALGLAQVNFDIVSRTTSRCVMTATGLALGRLKASIALFPPYGATATVS